MNNYVLCGRIYDNINDRTIGGLQKVSEAYNRDQYLPQNVERIFEVIALPEKLTEERGFWKTSIEIQVGDKIISTYHDSLNSKLIKTENREYRFILYYGIVAIIRGEDIIPINGNILFSPVYEEHKTSLILLDQNKVTDYRFGKVDYIGTPNEYYTKGYNVNEDKGIEINKGDKIVFTVPWGKFAPMLENPIHRKLSKDYYYCQRYYIGGKSV